MKTAPTLQEKVEDPSSCAGALPALQAQEQVLSSCVAPRVHPPIAAGTEIHRHEHWSLTPPSFINNLTVQFLLDYFTNG